MDRLGPVKSGKIKVHDVHLYYELYGEGDPLVLVAGTGISLAPWRVFQVPEFAKHYQVLIYDHRGLGRSDKPDVPYSTRLFARDCAGLMDALGIGKAHIMGHSMGGAGALFVDGREQVIGVMALDIVDNEITGIQGVVNPDKLAHLGPVADLNSLLRAARSP